MIPTIQKIMDDASQCFAEFKHGDLVAGGVKLKLESIKEVMREIKTNPGVYPNGWQLLQSLADKIDLGNALIKVLGFMNRCRTHAITWAEAVEYITSLRKHMGPENYPDVYLSWELELFTMHSVKAVEWSSVAGLCAKDDVEVKEVGTLSVGNLSMLQSKTQAHLVEKVQSQILHAELMLAKTFEGEPSTDLQSFFSVSLRSL